MNINDVLRANQAGVIEIAGLEIKRVEGPLRAIGGVVVAAGNIRFQSESGLPRGIPCVTAIQTDRPGKDGFIRKTSGLRHRFGVPIPLAFLTEPSHTKRMPLLGPCS